MKSEYNKYKINVHQEIVEGTEIWLGNDGIWRIKVRKGWTDEALEKLIIIVRESEKKLPAESKLLAELIFPFRIPSSKFRKRVTQFIKDSHKTSNFEKVAIYGGGITRKTIANFVIAASGIKNIKYFKTEEEALKWLKKD